MYAALNAKRPLRRPTSLCKLPELPLMGVEGADRHRIKPSPPFVALPTADVVMFATVAPAATLVRSIVSNCCFVLVVPFTLPVLNLKIVFVYVAFRSSHD